MIEANSDQLVQNDPIKAARDSCTSLKKKVSSMLSSCRICLSAMFEPASLTCGHMFCEQCINKYWHSTDKPDYIVCPLCRAPASNIAFVKKEDTNSTEDLRKVFKLSHSHSQHTDSESSSASLFCVKLSILVPMFYFTVKWLRYPLIGLLKYFQVKMYAAFED